MELQKGIYRHYKGKEYEVLDIATHSETLEKMVIYKQQYGEFATWVRPLSMFIEEVELNGQRVKRFEYMHMALPG